MKFSIAFAWFDLWIGAFWHRADRVLYICPLPMFVLKFDFGGRPQNPLGGQSNMGTGTLTRLQHTDEVCTAQDGNSYIHRKFTRAQPEAGDSQ